MRPIFVIYLTAGITLLFAVLNAAANIGQAYVTHHAIVTLKPEGDDLSRMQAAQSQDLDGVAEWCVLALLQTGIIFSARKLGRQTVLPTA